MAYIPLARKYRPNRFSEMIGQTSTSLALCNSIRLGREPHGVIFTGVRGIGKTTLARLYAKALNCEQGPTPDPCGKCASCEAIASGRHEDVSEIDGATHTGVDSVRELIETLNYVPQRSRFRINIIDEVHMLSTSAFNALLKSLEEPPAHVVFVFATTELHKVPQTIIGRCQTFHLSKFRVEQIIGRVRDILEAERISYEEAALAIVARAGHGSMRDALTFLDQAINLGGGKLTVESLHLSALAMSSLPLIEWLSAASRRDARAVLEAIEGFDQSGREFDTLLEDAARLARHAFVLRDLGPEALNVANLGLDDGEISALVDLATSAPAMELNRLFRCLVRARQDLDGSGLDRFIVENLLCEWCFDPGLPDLEAIASQIALGNVSSTTAPDTRTASQLSAPRSHTPAATREDARRMFSQLKAQLKPAPEPKIVASEPRLAPPEPAIPCPEPTVAPPETKPLPQTVQPVSHLESVMISEPVEATPPPVVAAPPVVVAPAVTPAAPAPSAPAALRPFPATWRELVELWKTLKPLQARHLADTILVSYGTELITLAVEENSLTWRTLTQKVNIDRLRQELAREFGFSGQIRVIPRTSEHASPPPPAAAEEVAPSPAIVDQSPTDVPPQQTSSSPPSPLTPPRPQETLEATWAREAAEKRQATHDKIVRSPLTQEALRVFQAKIDRVEIHENASPPQAGGRREGGAD